MDDNLNACADRGDVFDAKMLVGVNGRATALTSEAECAVTRRLAVGKSKSVGHTDVYARQGNKCLESAEVPGPTSRMELGLNLSQKRPNVLGKVHDTRTVKSDTACLSPTKPTRVASFKHVGLHAPKRSPSSIFDFDAVPAPERDCSERKLGISISCHERSVLQQFQGFDNSSSKLDASGNFSDEETIDTSSFANEDLASIPTSLRFSNSSISVPSDLTGSHPTLEAPFSSPNRQASKMYSVVSASHHPATTAASCSSADFIPLPPRRQCSNRLAPRIRNSPLVPSQIRCLPMDASPMKPSRQMSVRRLSASKSSSSIMTSSSIDDSPTILPRRQYSRRMFNSDESQYTASCISIDSSPLKPQRQKSVKAFFAPPEFSFVSKNSTEDALRRSTSTPERRMVSRCESILQPRLPTLSRRSSITGEPIEDRRRSPRLHHAVIAEESAVENPTVIDPTHVRSV